MVSLGTSPLLQRSVKLSNSGRIWLEIVFHCVMLPQLGLLTLEECGLVPGCQVRDRVSAKVKSERDLLRVSFFGSFVRSGERHVSWVHEISGQKLTFVYPWDLHCALRNGLLFYLE